MAGLNKAMIIGRVGKDPELRYMQNGNAVCNFSVATSESWNDKNTGEKQERTEWHRVTVYGKLAEICGEYLTKGNQNYIEGKLQAREWEDKEGNKKTTTEIIASTMQMLGSVGEGKQKEEPKQKPKTTDDDIPF